MLKDCCSVCNFADDSFIGIQFQEGLPHVTFPRGYTLSDDNDAIRKDILGLITILQRFSNQREGQNRIGDGEDQMAFPILSYQYVISTTTSIYLHAFQDANARASEAIANVLDFSKKETPPPDQNGRERKIRLIKTSCGQKASSGQ